MSGKDKVKLLNTIINRITTLIIIIVLAALMFTHKPASLNATIEILVLCQDLVQVKMRFSSS